MKKDLKNYLLNRIDAAKESVKSVWANTSNETPEDRICYSILQNLEALEMLLSLSKTED